MAPLSHGPTVRLCGRLCSADRRSVDVDPTSLIVCVSASWAWACSSVAIRIRNHTSQWLLRPFQRGCVAGHLGVVHRGSAYRLRFVFELAHRGSPSLACAVEFGTECVVLYRARPRHNALCARCAESFVFVLDTTIGLGLISCDLCAHTLQQCFSECVSALDEPMIATFIVTCVHLI